jgi:hypothetical protein
MSHPLGSGNGTASPSDGQAADQPPAAPATDRSRRPPPNSRVDPDRDPAVHPTAAVPDSANDPIKAPPTSGSPNRVAGRPSVVALQKERFGGIKVSSAFFGWLTATGMSVLLIALLAAGGVVFGVATDSSVSVDQAVQESEQVTGTAQTVGLIGAITLLVVLLVAYYCGGYVAGRMARFNGVRQGLAVWLWGVVMALIVAAVAAIAGSQYDVFAQLNLPRLPVNEGQVTAVGAIAIAAAILAALIGALFGGLTGMRFHRTIDKAGLDPTDY